MKCPECGRLMRRTDETYRCGPPRYPTPEDDLIWYWRCGYCHTCRREIKATSWLKRLFGKQCPRCGSYMKTIQSSRDVVARNTVWLCTFCFKCAVKEKFMSRLKRLFRR